MRTHRHTCEQLGVCQSRAPRCSNCNHHDTPASRRIDWQDKLILWACAVAGAACLIIVLWP